MPTARNARGVDIIAYNRDCSRMIAVQVKTLSKKNPVPLGTSLDKVMGDFWVIVNNVVSDPQAYVMRPGEVRKLAHRREKDGRVSFWLQPSSYCVDEFHEAWKRIGEPDGNAQQDGCAYFQRPRTAFGKCSASALGHKQKGGQNDLFDAEPSRRNN